MCSWNGTEEIAYLTGAALNILNDLGLIAKHAIIFPRRRDFAPDSPWPPFLSPHE